MPKTATLGTHLVRYPLTSRPAASVGTSKQSILRTVSSHPKHLPIP